MISLTTLFVCCAVTHSDNMALSSNIGHVKRSAVVKSVSRWKVNLGKKESSIDNKKISTCYS